MYGYHSQVYSGTIAGRSMAPAPLNTAVTTVNPIIAFFSPVSCNIFIFKAQRKPKPYYFSLRRTRLIFRLISLLLRRGT